MITMHSTQKTRFITIEGIEGAGKSTALNIIENYLKQLSIGHVLTREPGGTQIAEQIRRVILQHHQETMQPDTELLLMFASRAQHVATVIKPALAANQWVISDRFTDATYAYQGGGRRISDARIAQLETWTLGNLEPDLTILLDVSVEVGLQRARNRSKPDRIEAEQVDFFHGVRKRYLQRAKSYPERFRIIDASQSILEITVQLQQIILQLLE